MHPSIVLNLGSSKPQRQKPLKVTEEKEMADVAVMEVSRFQFLAEPDSDLV